MKQVNEQPKTFPLSLHGVMPDIIDALANFNESVAIEQVEENKILYTGRTKVTKKVRALIAMATAIAEGTRESAIINFGIAKKFGAVDEEIMDAIRATRMALMASTMDDTEVIVRNLDEGRLRRKNSEDPANMLEVVRKEAKEIPVKLVYLSKFSMDLAKEHLREKTALLTPLKLDVRDVFAIAYGVAVSLHDRECQKVYFDQFLNHGGTLDEAEDIIAVVRFITGNKAFINSLEILRSLSK